MPKQFQVIVADPPWPFADKLQMSDVARGAAANYKLMTMQDIKDMPMKEYADPNGAILALWVPSSLLQDGLDTMKAWGFEHKQTYIWVKTKKFPLTKLYSHITKFMKAAWKIKGDQKFMLKDYLEGLAQAVTAFNMTDTLGFGMGRLFRQTHEIVLVGTNNNKIYKSLKNKSQRSVSFAPNLKHSSKPDNLQLSLEEMFPSGDKLELFARRHLSGWTCLGNEICNGEDILVSLAKL